MYKKVWIFILIGWILPFSAQALGIKGGRAQIILGNKKAPVTVYMYSALTCGHCAVFHEETLPKIKDEYIDKGKIRLIMRPFPIDGASMQGAKVVYSFPLNEMRLRIQDKLYHKQNLWAFSDPEDLAERISVATDLSLADVKRALEDKKVENRVLKMTMYAEKNHAVNASPTFIIGMRRFDYAISYEEFVKAIEPMLKVNTKNG